MLAEPRALGQRWSDGVWLRLVDVQRALAARRYAAGGSVSAEAKPMEAAPSRCWFEDSRFSQDF
jgi:hypothetical protein